MRRSNRKRRGRKASTVFDGPPASITVLRVCSGYAADAIEDEFRLEDRTRSDGPNVETGR
jgi:hypothetical protein